MRTPRGSALRLRTLLPLASSLLAAAAIRFDLLPWLRGPAPYPPEWQWGYRAAGPARPLLAAALLAAGLLVALAASGGRWARDRPRLAARGLLAAATLGGACLQWALLEREPQGALRALMARAISPSISSYHAVAVSDEARDALAFLQHHASLLPRLARDRKHAATHPPGPVLWYRGALALCERGRTLTDGLLGLAGVEPGPTQTEQGRAIRAAALLGALGLTLVAMLLPWPLAALGEALGLPPLAAARLAALWPLLPGPALMTPALDAAVALPIVACAALVMRTADVARWRGVIGGGALAGACAAVALFGSYGSASFLAIATASAVVAATGRRQGGRVLVASTVAGGVALGFGFGLPALFGLRPLLALRTALSIHRALFTAPRDYGVWLVFDPLDFALFLGLPLALASAASVRAAARRVAARTPLETSDRFLLAGTAGILALLLLGVTRGEVGRLWIPLMPFALLTGLAGRTEGASAREVTAYGVGLTLLTLVMAGYWLV